MLANKLSDVMRNIKFTYLIKREGPKLGCLHMMNYHNAKPDGHTNIRYRNLFLPFLRSRSDNLVETRSWDTFFVKVTLSLCFCCMNFKKIALIAPSSNGMNFRCNIFLVTQWMLPNTTIDLLTAFNRVSLLNWRLSVSHRSLFKYANTNGSM